jgi:hypothetical protein
MRPLQDLGLTQAGLPMSHGLVCVLIYDAIFTHNLYLGTLWLALVDQTMIQCCEVVTMSCPCITGEIDTFEWAGMSVFDSKAVSVPRIPHARGSQRHTDIDDDMHHD